MTEDNTLEIMKEVSKEIAKGAYTDVAHPTAKATGELAGLVPRAIKAALAPVEKWILQREYNVAETIKLLENNLKDTPPELIEPAEPYIAVPAIQYISYCMDNDELRNMYAKLLASAINKITKSGVHPGYLEIIKQLCPDEAKILEFFYMKKAIPTITLRIEKDDGFGMEYVSNYSEINELGICEYISRINSYYDNLIRLGLLNKSNPGVRLDTDEYELLKESKYIKMKLEYHKNSKSEYSKTIFLEEYFELTNLGEAFCDICIC